MPKAMNPIFPLEGLFGLIKPSGPASMVLLDRLKPLFNESPLFVTDKDERQRIIDARKNSSSAKNKRKKRKDAIKIGQGGTLDPLADGVLVIGINKGTKSLAKFLNCTKEYYTTALLGCETDSYDSQGAKVRIAPFSHVTRERINAALGSFRGEISQLPPIYSALKMDGKPLYEYARNGLALPRPIEPRKVTVHSLELVDWKEAQRADTPGHNFKWPEKTLDAQQLAAMDRVRRLIAEAGVPALETPTSAPHLPPSNPSSPSIAQPDSRTDNALDQNPELDPPVFTLKMVVSSGTYVRSIVHDLAHAVGSAAHVVTLTRTRQGDFGVGPKYIERTTSQSEGNNFNVTATGSGLISTDDLYGGDCVPWEVFEKALENRDKGTDGQPPSENDIADGEHEEWEKLLLARWHPPT